MKHEDPVNVISIHALFAEGDCAEYDIHFDAIRFLSTPSSQRATRLGG